MKMTLSKLIANDIINYGMGQTSNFNYSVFLDSYVDDFELDDVRYIADSLLSDEQTKNLAIEKIRNVKLKDYEL